jgi:RNA polymerase sigma-70 factor (ECF subfamily)
MAESQPEEIEAVRSAVLDAYRQHAGELSRIAMTSIRNQSLAQDVLQETFLRYFMTRMHGEVVTDERDWLCRVMRGVIADWKRSAALDCEVALEDAADAAQESEGDESATRVLPWAGKAARILAPREQECIQLRAQGLEYREIATAMQIDIGTVGTLLNRAVRKLKQVLRSREKMA